jgi:hypothetical protein
VGSTRRLLTREELLAHLVSARICGDVDTPRQSNLRNAQRCADGEPGYRFGLSFRRDWTYPEVVALLADRVGINPDLDHTEGQDTIDPDRCADQLAAMADRIGLAASRRERVLIATGHPTGILAIHLAVAAALETAGATVLRVRSDWTDEARGRKRSLRQLGGVSMVMIGGDLAHTHDPEPMHGILAELDSRGEPRPDLVIADHGFAGAAAMAGLEVIAFADCNDPALFVAEAEGLVQIAVPLDDNVRPDLYEPLTALLLSKIQRPVERSGAIGG